VLEPFTVAANRRIAPGYQASFVSPGRRAQDLIPWVRRQAIGVRGENREVEIPESWSPLAAEVVAFSYLRRREDGRLETSIKEMVERAVRQLGWRVIRLPSALTPNLRIMTTSIRQECPERPLRGHVRSWHCRSGQGDELGAAECGLDRSHVADHRGDRYRSTRGEGRRRAADARDVGARPSRRHERTADRPLRAEHGGQLLSPWHDRPSDGVPAMGAR
jgi:hypothetical protein